MITERGTFEFPSPQTQYSPRHLPPLTIHHVFNSRESVIFRPFRHAVIHPVNRIKSQLTPVIIRGISIVRSHHQLILSGHELVRLIVQIL